MQATTYGPDANQVSAQVARVLTSRVFIGSPRLCRFLRFVVDQTLKGNLSRLKEQVIGVEVYDRKVDYDNRVDPIVRMEARRLRDKLKAYYRSTGRGDEIVIGLPKGGYLPLFTLRRSPPKQSILVIPIVNLTQDTKDDYFSLGLTQELTHLLTRIPVLRVVAWASSSFPSETPLANLAGSRQRFLVDTILGGSVRRSPDRVRVTVQLIASKSGEYLWSETYDEKLEDMFATQEHIARAIVQSLRIKLTAPRELEPRP